jgi:hypothetical protein
MECSSWSSIGIPAAMNAAIKLAVPTMLKRESNPPAPMPLTPLPVKKLTIANPTGGIAPPSGASLRQSDLKRSGASELKRSGGGALRASAT